MKQIKRTINAASMLALLMIAADVNAASFVKSIKSGVSKAGKQVGKLVDKASDTTVGKAVSKAANAAAAQAGEAIDDALEGYHDLDPTLKQTLKTVAIGAASTGATIGAIASGAAATIGTGGAAAPLAGIAATSAGAFAGTLTHGAFSALDYKAAQVAAERLKKRLNPFGKDGSIDEEKLDKLAKEILREPATFQVIADTWQLSDEQMKALVERIKKLQANK